MSHLSVRDKVGAVAIAAVAGCLVAGVFLLAAAGLFWWSEIPLSRPTAFFAWVTGVAGAATFLLVLWQFVAGYALPGEVWSDLTKFFHDGGDVAP
jgi:hypothetical protein